MITYAPQLRGRTLLDLFIPRRLRSPLVSRLPITSAESQTYIDTGELPDPCPKGDPDCETGDDGSCHDACEAPR